MDYKKKSDNIRICILLIKDAAVSKTLRIRKLNELADLSDMSIDNDILKKEFVEKYLELLRLNQKVKWMRYYKQVLLRIENYELLVFLQDLFKPYD